MPAALAFRYARALADLAGPGSERIAQELEIVERALKESNDLRIAFESPAVPPPRKRAVIAALTRMLGLSDLLRRFLSIVVEHRRTSLLGDIREAFQAVMDERLGVVRVDVSSARALGDEQRSQLVAELVRMTGKKTRAEFGIREELIGGVLAQIGSTVYDGSVRGRLQAMKRRLAGTD